MGTTAVYIVKVIQCHLVPSKDRVTHTATIEKGGRYTKQCIEIALIIFIDEIDIYIFKHCILLMHNRIVKNVGHKIITAKLLYVYFNPLTVSFGDI